MGLLYQAFLHKRKAYGVIPPMGLMYLFILALIQGVTEFLPVSSSGHLVLIHALHDGQSAADMCYTQNRQLDIAVHVGTLLSVLVYYWRDVLTIMKGVFTKNHSGQKLFIHLFIASIPVIIAGFLLHLWQPSFLCLVTLMAWMSIFFGIVLWAADHFFPAEKKIEEMSMKDAAMIGLAQSLALLPGTSRSGVTMSAARFLGYTRVEATRFSLLLAIIAISGAGTLMGFDLWQEGDFTLGMDMIILVAVSFLSGLGAIALMVKWLEKSTFLPFAIYRIILGGVILVLLYSGVLI